VGGRGSGRVSSTRRVTCDDLPAVDLAHLRRHGMLALGHISTLRWSSGSEDSAISIIGLGSALKLCYRTPNEDVAELVELVATPACFGGRRQWLKCPGCGQACRVLRGYRGRFRCRRNCHHFPYTSQYEQPYRRALVQADRIKKRLQSDHASDGDDFPPRPKRMRWATYRWLEERHDDLQGKWLQGAMTRLGL
jgi:hypothetical protein